MEYNELTEAMQAATDIAALCTFLRCSTTTAVLNIMQAGELNVEFLEGSLMYLEELCQRTCKSNSMIVEIAKMDYPELSEDREWQNSYMEIVNERTTMYNNEYYSTDRDLTYYEDMLVKRHNILSTLFAIRDHDLVPGDFS